jgi:photosystem II stability/assembly factor-like uncharacterized protein
MKAMKPVHSPLAKSATLLAVAAMLLCSCRPERSKGQWYQQDSKGDAAFFLVNFVSDRQGWVVGWNGEAAKETQGWIVLTTGDGGITWEPMPGQVESKIRSVYFTTPTTGWAIATEHNILSTIDGGATWQTQRTAGTVEVRNEAYPQPVSIQPEPIDHLLFINSAIGWAWGGGQRREGFSQPGVLLRTLNGGRIWTTLGFPFENDLVALQFVDQERGWACENKGACYRSDDGGRSWKKLTTREGLAVNALQFVDRDNGWIVSNSGYALRTSDGGVTWRLRRTGSREDLRDVFFLTPRQGWIVGNSGTVLFTVNGGDDWQPMDVGVREDLTRVRFAGPQHGWAVGNGGVILHYALGS